LDIDLTEIRSLINDVEGYNWFTERGFGRYLRSPTVYEDCIKIVSTANQYFLNTKKIIQSLVENYGCNVNGFKVFPEPNQLIRVSESSLKTRTNCGYRAKFFLDIADKSLKNPDFFIGDDWKSLQAKDFFERLLEIHGMGSLSASYLCRIYGKPYNYSIDSMVIKRCDDLWGLNFRKKDKRGKEKADLEKYEEYVNSRYESFREYGPHVFWFEISKHWHNKKIFKGAWWK
jgi:3-methyladenine DNA glycosylase/8-oxoguanine DNA glycosylase